MSEKKAFCRWELVEGQFTSVEENTIAGHATSLLGQCDQTMTTFSGHNTVGYCIITIFSLWLLHLDTETRRDLSIFRILSCSWSSLSRCRCREADNVHTKKGRLADVSKERTTFCRWVHGGRTIVGWMGTGAVWMTEWVCTAVLGGKRKWGVVIPRFTMHQVCVQ